MAFVRIYTGADGKSRFEELDMGFQPTDSNATGSVTRNATSVTFRRQPVGLIQDWHVAPRRQYVITLTGMAELEAGNGEKRTFGPADVLLADDLTGDGHVTRVIGSGPRISATIPLDE